MHLDHVASHVPTAVCAATLARLGNNDTDTAYAGLREVNLGIVDLK